MYVSCNGTCQNCLNNGFQFFSVSQLFKNIFNLFLEHIRVEHFLCAPLKFLLRDHWRLRQASYKTFPHQTTSTYKREIFCLYLSKWPILVGKTCSKVIMTLQSSDTLSDTRCNFMYQISVSQSLIGRPFLARRYF